MAATLIRSSMPAEAYPQLMGRKRRFMSLLLFIAYALNRSARVRPSFRDLGGSGLVDGGHDRVHQRRSAEDPLVGSAEVLGDHLADDTEHLLDLRGAFHGPSLLGDHGTALVGSTIAASPVGLGHLPVHAGRHGLGSGVGAQEITPPPPR